MGGVFNLIKKLFSGILSFIGGIFGGNKSGYYMELDESQLPKPIAKAKEAIESKAEDAKSAVAAVEATARSTANSVADSVKETATATEETAKTAVKSKAKKVEPITAEKAETNGSVNGAKPPVPADTLNLPQPTVSFATEYLVPKPTNTRRRPGANMNSYLEMAKSVKTPNN